MDCGHEVVGEEESSAVREERSSDEVGQVNPGVTVAERVGDVEAEVLFDRDGGVVVVDAASVSRYESPNHTCGLGKVLRMTARVCIMRGAFF